MRVIVVGLGVQGRKRLAVAGSDVVAIVDPVAKEANYDSVAEVPLDAYDAALLCVPDEPKNEIITYLLSNKKHVLVEKPLFAENSAVLANFKELSRLNNVACYTAYNHRFEPHISRMKQLIDSGSMGAIYAVRLFYGNGTARLVRNSNWRDKGAGVLPDLGSHLLDTLLYWFGIQQREFSIHSSNSFENKSPDYVVFGSKGLPDVQMEVTLLSWKNHFYADILAEKASAHIVSLCKWGPATFSIRERQLPSGRPNESITTLSQSDPTWSLEYEHFKRLCKKGENNLDNDIWINSVLSKLCGDIVLN